VTDRHPGDALSALVDGELDAPGAADVRAHVADCAACAAELAQIRGARLALRRLPAVEPPPGFLESFRPGSNVVPLRSRRRRVVGANVAAAAAAAVAAIALLGAPPGAEVSAAVAAEPQGAADRHDATVSAISAGAGSAAGLVLPDREVSPTTAPARSVDDLPGAYAAPDELAGYRLVGAYRMDAGVHLLYEKGRHRLSVFEQEGDLGDLPPGLRRVDDDVWQWDDPRAQGRVVVVAHDGMVVTVVGDESPEAVLGAARALPGVGGESAAFARRLRRACGDVLEALSPAG
jgi:anti-sigma factor RsiW